ncbi:MAG: hypothetical protein IT569_00540 [Leptospiraceae bacterium]|nr:hypothetical protein [Leptospiraceae bacterium]
MKIRYSNPYILTIKNNFQFYPSIHEMIPFYNFYFRILYPSFALYAEIIG